MPKATRICKVCGKEYEYCHTQRRVPGVFRWVDVACSPECGSIYLERIRASRAKTENSVDVAEVNEVEPDAASTDYMALIDEEDDEEDWFEDEEEEDDEDDAF